MRTKRTRFYATDVVAYRVFGDNGIVKIDLIPEEGDNMHAQFSLNQATQLREMLNHTILKIRENKQKKS